MNIRFLATLLAIFALFSCEKTPGPVTPDPVFEVSVNNEFNELQARYAIFVSDPNTGETRAFRWIPSEDTIQLQVPNSKTTDVFDCTVLKITMLIAPGTGVRDTILDLKTYTRLSSGEKINLRDQVYQKGSVLTFNLTGMNSVDSVVVSDAYAITRPTPANNFFGEYYCYHSGKCWMRVLTNGDPFWKFARFDNVTGNIEANAINTNILLSIFSPPLKLNLPFVSNWDYKVDGLVDTAKLEFFPLSAQLIPPGSFVPQIDKVDIFEPVNNDQFEPNRPYNGFRVQTRGVEPATGGYTYISDHFYDALPAALPVPTFNLEPTILADNRLIGVVCSGDFDLLAFSRARTGDHVSLKINWEVFIQPRTGIVSYRLPDVPTPLGDLYKPLRDYSFDDSVLARADAYEAPISYPTIIRHHLSSQDVLWQARAGYLGREEKF